jgi:phosphoribosyl 1,2-cyclic phosphodiesterase
VTTASNLFSLRFWGVRGSLPCPGPAYTRYGGNTSCLEIRCGPHLLIFDGGTGLRPLGEHLMAQVEKSGGSVDADVFFTHTHLDHMVGVPFFGPLFHAESNLRLWAGHLAPQRSIRDALSGMMVEPLFPIPPEVFSSCPSYHDFIAGEVLTPYGGLTIRTAALNHPNGATGYRVEWQGKSICYVTDCEHHPNTPDQGIIDLIRGTDIFIYDCTYTDEEYPKHAGWGHSTWQEGARLADLAGVKTFVLFHHDPAHDDVVMDRIAREAEARRSGTLVAKEGMILTP